MFVKSEIRAWLDGAPLELVELPRAGRAVRLRGYMTDVGLGMLPNIS